MRELREGVRRALPALACAAPALPRVLEITHRAAHAALGRDQGIFHYVAWAVLQGEVLYRDVRDVNGPLVAMLHALVLGLFGPSDHALRVFDLVASGLAFAVLGAAVADLHGAPRRLSRAAWALAAWVILSAQYLAYGAWDTAQRESLFDVFVAFALAAALSAQRLLAARGPSRKASVLLGLAGACSILPCAGKPTFVVFTAAQVLTLLVDRLPVSRARRLVPFGIGAGLGLSLPLAFLLLRGDARAYLAISVEDVPSMYRFIWPRPLADMLTTWGPSFAYGAATSAGALALVATGVLPRRALALALLPGLGLASVLLQGKGFDYHFHPVTLGGALAILAAVRVAAGGAAARARAFPYAVALLLALAVGAHAARALPLSTFPPVKEGVAESDPERLAPFERIDFFPRGLFAAASFVRAHTATDARVFAYGMDAYLLFLAERRSSVPYIYAYDLDVDAALAGASVYGGSPPTDAERGRIRAIGARHAADLARRLDAAPPAAVVLVDGSPLMTQPDALVDLDLCCADAARIVRTRYEEAVAFEGVRVWLPRRNQPVTGLTRD